jgi:mono/diheme cytochrome c family protein
MRALGVSECFYVVASLRARSPGLLALDPAHAYPRTHYPGTRIAACFSCASLLILLTLTACNVFPEMHYSPAQRRGEPTRLAPPPDAVPVTGARPAYTFDEAATLRAPASTPDGSHRGAELYRVNCAMCHGADGRGESLVAEQFRASGAIPPVDLASPRVRERAEGELYWLIANGIGNMPPFGSLLTEEELWLVVSAVRSLPTE